MSTLDQFRNPVCPRCGQRQLLQIGDAHYVVVPLLLDEGRDTRRAPDLTCYAKACSNCGYVELFSKMLIDRFFKVETAVEEFGEISRSPDGQYLVSIFKTYMHRGVPANDFTVPLSAGEWFELCLELDSLSDRALVDRILVGPYQKAWLERIGPIPPDLGAHLRALIRRFLKQGKQDSAD